MPPVALGIDWMRAGLEGGTRRYPRVHIRLRSVRRVEAILAWKIKLLAHDNKPGARCLLNRCAASGRTASGQRNLCRGFSSVSEPALGRIARGSEVRI
jgi:hypothetical protein